MPSAVLAYLGAALVVFGVFLLSTPAGFITAGVVAVCAAYVIRYLEVSSDEDA